MRGLGDRRSSHRCSPPVTLKAFPLVETLKLGLGRQALARADLEARLKNDALYLDAVVKEVMRLCPAAPIVVRKLLEPMELGGYTLPAGTTVAPCVHLVHRRPDIYPEPLAFRPERFLERPAGTYTWIPFGGGCERCLAASYAQLLMKQVIRTVVCEVELRTVEPRSELPRKSAITFVPDRYARVIAARSATYASRQRRADQTLNLPNPEFALQTNAGGRHRA
jgi:cytochrome P450